MRAADALTVIAAALAVTLAAAPAAAAAPVPPGRGAPAPSASTASRPACGPPRATTVIAAEGARVFARWIAARDGGRRVRAYFACTTRGPRPFALRRSRWEGADGYAPIRLRRSWVAYGMFEGCGTCGDSRTLVLRMDLRTGRSRGLSLDAIGDGRDVTVWDLEATRGGTVVWMEEALGPDGRMLSVRAMNGDGAPRTLDRDRAIVLRSLTLRGRTAYWSAADGPRSAPLG